MNIVATKKRRIVIMLIAVVTMVIFSIATAVTLHYTTPNPTINDTEKPTKTDNEEIVASPPPPTVVKLAAMGDMLAHDTIIANAKTDSSYDFRPYFQHIRPLYQDADLVFCNQEGPSAGPKYGISGYPSFNAPLEFSAGLEGGAGCNVISLANNHLGDKGVSVTNATIDNWGSLNSLAIAGANKSASDQQKVAYTEVKGIKISFLAFADFNNNRATPSYSVNIYHNITLFKDLIKEARANSDVVIVSMHWGTEDSPLVNTDQKKQVATLASLGADIVIGTGPHVLQPVEIIKRSDGKDMVVWYSIGNMLSSQLRIPQLFSGIATLEIVKNPETNEISMQNLGFIPTYMHYEWTAAQEANSQLLARKNPMIYPLSKSAEVLLRSNHATTVEQQRNRIVSILGSEVTVR